MRKLNLVFFAMSSFFFVNNVNAACPSTITHDEARAIANGEKDKLTDPMYKHFAPVGNMKDNVVKKGTSSAYTMPHLTNSEEIPVPGGGVRLKCTYGYDGKITKRSWTFQIDIPKI
ncbi:MAG: hypothetical protein Q8L85_08180 [Alphaproteobacteria bacterium]|nr:hypothetical protein [Alphaproteobacteria bacterium]